MNDFFSDNCSVSNEPGGYLLTAKSVLQKSLLLVSLARAHILKTDGSLLCSRNQVKIQIFLLKISQFFLKI